jgi:hypothetical protein
VTKLPHVTWSTVKARLQDQLYGAREQQWLAMDHMHQDPYSPTLHKSPLKRAMSADYGLREGRTSTWCLHTTSALSVIFGSANAKFKVLDTRGSNDIALSSSIIRLSAELFSCRAARQKFARQARGWQASCACCSTAHQAYVARPCDASTQYIR